MVLRIICQNICYCQGFTGAIPDQLQLWKGFVRSRGVAEKIAEWTKAQAPDVIGFSEIDFGSVRSGFDQRAFFEKYLDIPYSAGDIKYRDALWRKLPIFRNQGNAMFSRHVILDEKRHMLGMGMKQLALEITIEYQGAPLTFILVHLALQRHVRAAQLVRLAEIVEDVPYDVVVMGDFNNLLGMHELYDFRRLSGLKLHATDAKTFPAHRPSKRIDLLFHSPGLQIHEHQVARQLFSDHRPILVDLSR